MKYQNALKVVEKNQHLIVRQFKGLRIDEVIICPLKAKSLKEFLELYLQNYNSLESIKPFIGEELNVVVVCDIKRLDSNGWFAPLPIEYIEDAILDVE